MCFKDMNNYKNKHKQKSTGCVMNCQVHKINFCGKKGRLECIVEPFFRMPTQARQHHLVVYMDITVLDNNDFCS